MIKQNIMPDWSFKKIHEGIADRNRWPRTWWYPVPPQGKRHRDAVKQLHESYAKTINKTMFALLGVGLYCLLKVFGESDKSLIVANTTIQTPVVGTAISFQSFLVVAPFLLVILTVYLHIVYGHWLQLERERERENKKTEEKNNKLADTDEPDSTIESIPALFSFKERLPRLFTNLVFYWFVPLTLWFMARKAFALREFILPFSFGASIVTLALLFLQINRCPDSKPQSEFTSKRSIWNLFLWSAMNLFSKRGFWNLPRWIAFGALAAFTLNLPSLSESFRRPLDLQREDLHGAWLQGLDMAGADMNNANLQGANLAGANLQGADLQNANLHGTHLKGAHLQKAHLNGTNLQGANLGGADFEEADLFSANFREVKEMEPYRIKTAVNWNRAFYESEMLKFLKLSPTHNDDLASIGTYFDGGKIAYIFQPGDKGYVNGKRHGLIAAEADINTTYTDAWTGKSITDEYRWSTGQYENENKSDYAWQGWLNTSTLIGEGKANTDNILAKYPTATFPNSAAAVARAYRGGGYDDWYLPSKDELNQLYLNRSAVGGFASGVYWSSTEYNAGNAWDQGFGSGGQLNYYEGNEWRVRPVRAF
jgi:uncharacterized protein YjbI with pentapeptide repeats